MGKFLQMDNIVRTSISPVRTYPIFFENRDFFPPLLPMVNIHVSGENNHRKKRIFSKPLSKVKIFENAGLSFLSMILYSHRTGHAL